MAYSNSVRTGPRRPSNGRDGVKLDPRGPGYHACEHPQRSKTELPLTVPCPEAALCANETKSLHKAAQEGSPCHDKRAEDRRFWLGQWGGHHDRRRCRDLSDLAD